MRHRAPAGAGSAAAEYLGSITAVGLMMLALIAVREHQPHRRPPIDPVARIGAIVRPPPVIRAPRVRPRGPAVPARPRRPGRPRPTVLAPVWAIGW